MFSRCIKSIETSKQFADSGTLKAAKDKEIAWLKSIRKQAKSEWSKEDEEKLKEIIDIIGYSPISEELENEYVSFLKSLHPSWKPSEEQMEALLNAEGFLRAGLQHDSAKTIAELYEQLKKLM